MDASRFTEKAREALADSQKLAAKFDHQQIDASTSCSPCSISPRALRSRCWNKLGVPAEALTIQVQRLLEKIPKVTGQGVSQSASSRFNKVLGVAEDEAKKLKDEFLSVDTCCWRSRPIAKGPGSCCAKPGRVGNNCCASSARCAGASA